MIEILSFIFQDFWHWLGVVILIRAILPRNFTITKKRKTKKEKESIQFLKQNQG